MKKTLSYGLMLLALALMVGLTYTVAIGDRNAGSSASVIPAQSDPDMELKDELAPTHVDSNVPWEEPGRPAPWSTGVIPTDEEIQQKLDAENVGPLGYRPAPDPTLRTNPFRSGSPRPGYTPSTDLMFEGFEGGLVPPTSWTTVVNNAYTWEIDTYNPFEGTYNASCYYDQSYSGTQDEWLISPSLDLTTGGVDWVLDFAWLGSYYWSVDPYNNCDLEIWISTDGGTSFSTMLWDENSFGVFDSWTWYQSSISLAAYSAETNVKIGFHYAGYDGAQFSVDGISVNDAAAPTGRCCYGDPGAPSCADGITEAECAAMGGNWTQGLDCTTECPVAGGNDDCTAAELIPGPFPATVNGTTVGATIDCPGVLDWNAVWYKFDVTGACANVSVDYCGTPVDAQCIGIVVYPDCSDCSAYMIADNYAFAACGDGSTNPNMNWLNLPGPATYYLPVFFGDANCDPTVETDFQFTIDVQECPPAQPGDNCSEPLVINIGAEGELPYTATGQYTCGRGDNDNATCLGYYDGGEDIFYQLNVSATVSVNITLDPMGTTYTGFAVDASCPLNPSTCLATSTSSSGSPHTLMGLDLTPGTYFIMVDTWPSPDCIPDFTLTIEAGAGPTPGDDCTDPIPVKLPDDLPYADIGQYTCGRGNNYNSTCLGSYDGGEDVIYEIDVQVAGDFDIVMDPNGTSWTGMLIDGSCPPNPSTCIAKVTGSSSSPKGFYNLHLEPGFYYIMIDTWPSPNCIPNLDLTITESVPPDDNDAWELCDEIGEVVDQPFSTIGMTNDGPAGCMYSANIWYCYTASCSGVATVDLCGSGYDTKLAVYEGNDPFTGALLGCNDDSPCSGRSLQSEVSFMATAGNTYLIEVGGYSSATGSGDITISCSACDTPPNDNCEDVTPVVLTSGVPVTFTGNNSCASEQCASFPGPHVWEAFTINSAMDVTLDYCGSSPAFGNAWLNLAIGCPCTDFTFAAAFDFSTCGDGNVTMVWEDLPAGTYYYPVMNDPGYSADGPYTLNVVGIEASTLTANPTSIDFGTQPLGSTGSTILNLGASADQSINFSISYQYNMRGTGPGVYTDLSSVWQEKPPYSGPENTPDPNVIRQGGDDIATAVPITVPSVMTGTTVGYTNDYDEVCPYSGSTSPDVVYSYSPASDINIDISLCNSGYDTKLYVYDGGVGNLVACNDDECPGYRSLLENVALLGGHTYYIVIDGYGGDAGDYEMATEENVPPEPFACPDGASTEEEPCGGDLNGGCNMATPGFQSIECGETVCGTIWADGGTRDTDWYLLTLYSTTTVTLTGSANFPFVIGFVDTSDCALASALDPYATGSPDDVAQVAKECGPGAYWLFMSHSDYYSYPCGTANDYWLNVDCPPGPVLWLSASPESGTVPGNGTLPVTVSFDATELTEGFYSADLVITNDGARAVTTVPVSLTIGGGAPPYMFVPDTLYSLYMFGIDEMGAHLLIGDDHMAGEGGTAADVDLGSCVLTVTGTGINVGLTSATLLPSYPGMAGQVVDLAFPVTDYLLAEDPDSLIWDWVTSNYEATYSYAGGGSGAVTSSVPIRGHISGDLNMDGEINVSDLTMMIAYMFGGGPAPIFLELADVDASKQVDVADVTYLVAFMFNGGQAPFHN